MFQRCVETTLDGYKAVNIRDEQVASYFKVKIDGLPIAKGRWM